MVEVEERALGPLEEDMVAAPESVLDEPRHVGEVRRKAASPGERLLDERLDLEVGLGAERGEDGVLLGEQALEPRPERPLVEEVLEADPVPRCPILVRRSDAPTRRADARTTQSGLAGHVEGTVVREDHVGGEARPEPADIDPPRGQPVDLVDERRRVDDHARADDRDDVRVQHAGRDEMELEHLVTEHQRVAGVVAALVANDERRLLGEEVRSLALALVAPLEADDDRRRHQVGRAGQAVRPPDTKRPRSKPGSRVDLSRVPSPTDGRSGASKVLIRLTGRTTRLPRATAVSLGAARGLRGPRQYSGGDRVSGIPVVARRPGRETGDGTFSPGRQDLRWGRSRGGRK